jgi:hypothetical protein
MITHINPASLYESPAFSQATLVSRPCATCSRFSLRWAPTSRTSPR